jgi:hypothetical protein
MLSPVPLQALVANPHIQELKVGSGDAIADEVQQKLRTIMNANTRQRKKKTKPIRGEREEGQHL